jgi:Peptidase family M23
VRVPGRSFAMLLVSLLTAFVLQSSAGGAQEILTPILLAVHDAPVPFTGSDRRVHLVYELWMTNFSSAEVSVDQVEVFGDGLLLQTLDAAAVQGRLQPAGQRESAAKLPKGTQALLFLHIVLAPDAQIPRQLSHRVTALVSAAPPDHQKLTENGGAIAVDRRKVVLVGPPLHGDRFISADSCCDATRHTRAALPVNGRVWLAQRFAVDWEQLDAQGRIYSGPREKPESYTIFGQPALAVANAIVESVTDGAPEQTPGQYPTDISLDEADGNSVILDLGLGHYALYAHLQPGSIKVHRGERVRRGQVLALVGNSGNSVAPHLHFQVTDRPSSLASNGLPYFIDDFQVTGNSPGTDAFDEAESKGTPLAITPVSPAQPVKNALPLDQQEISFPGPTE